MAVVFITPDDRLRINLESGIKGFIHKYHRDSNGVVSRALPIPFYGDTPSASDLMYLDSDGYIRYGEYTLIGKPAPVSKKPDCKVITKDDIESKKKVPWV
jgi:hypothetical protein